ncbi:hypothetical protein ACIPWL_31880 [Streptomyces sp. NPDC090023]|uniref:hypothetical protein n=1 Tax=unclassified Streptomyces TaxID=2593676 RepID=UPI0038293072
MTSRTVVGRAMSARQFLATPSGVALRARHQGRFLGQIGTIIDLVDLVDSIAGGGPGLDVEDILNNHQEILDQLLKQQAELQEGMGGITDSLQGIGGDIDQIKDLVDQIANGNEEAQVMLQQILAEQRQMAREINRNLKVISSQVQGMWTEMNSWFALTISAIAGLADTLAEIQQQLARIEQLLEEVLAELAELHDRVDWNAVISMFAEHEHRVGYCIDAMMAITVLPATPARSGEDGAALQVDADSLETWARAVTDELNGLPYSLYCLHRVLVGDTLLGKSLMHVFCHLMAHKEEVDYREAARYFFKLAAVQAEGYAALAKARQAIALPEIDYAELFRERLLVQTASVNAALESGYGTAEWNDAVNRKDWMNGSLPSTLPEGATRPAQYFTVANNRQLIAAMVAPVSTTSPPRIAVEFYVGDAVPGSRRVDPGSVKMMTSVTDGRQLSSGDLYGVRKEEDPDTGVVHHRLHYYPQSYVFDPKYVMVGLKVSTDEDGVIRCEPLVAEYDEENGTTSWNGTSGGLWKATLDATCRPTVFDFGDRTQEWQQRLHFTFPPVGHRFPDPRAVSGFRMAFRRDGDRVWARPGLLDDTWEESTMLPANPQSDYLTYEPVTLP